MTELDILKSIGGYVGCILEGKEYNAIDRIKITAIGEERFLCRVDRGCKGIFSEEIGNFTLTCRDWKVVK